MGSETDDVGYFVYVMAEKLRSVAGWLLASLSYECTMRSDVGCLYVMCWRSVCFSRKNPRRTALISQITVIRYVFVLCLFVGERGGASYLPVPLCPLIFRPFALSINLQSFLLVRDRVCIYVVANSRHVLQASLEAEGAVRWGVGDIYICLLYWKAMVVMYT